MKLQQKLMALAILGIAAATPAHALINNGATDGNGELFFSIWSNNGTVATADDVSYMRDLGVNINDWSNPASPFALTAAKTTAGYVQSFAADATLSSFLSAIPVNAVVHWNVVGNDSAQAKRFVSTAAVGTVALPTQTVGNSRLVSTAIGSFLSYVNPFSDTQNGTPGSTSAVNNSNTAAFSNTLEFAGNVLWGTNLGGKTAFDTTGAIGAKLPFFLQYETSTLQTGNALQKQFADITDPTNKAYWKLDTSGNLSYNVAAVPVPAAAWLLGSGLMGLMGAGYRKRVSKHGISKVA